MKTGSILRYLVHVHNTCFSFVFSYFLFISFSVFMFFCEFFHVIKYLTFQKIFCIFFLQATIDYLKIDIEYNEWDSFQAMFDENSLKNVKQFAFEIHTNELHNKQTSTVEHFVSYYKTLRKLELLGFRKWLHHSNPFGRYQSTRTGKQQTCCYELYYVNTNFMKRKYHER